MKNNSKISQTREALNGILYPISKEKLIEFERNKGGNSRMLDILVNLPKKTFKNESEILRQLYGNINGRATGIKFPDILHIPKKFSQFNDDPALLVVVGKQEAIFYKAINGEITRLDLFKIPRPKYSDREGYFKIRSHGKEIRTGSDQEFRDDSIIMDFSKNLKKQLKMIIRKMHFSEVYLFAPNYLKNVVMKVFRNIFSGKVAKYIEGNYFKFSPLDLLLKLVPSKESLQFIPQEAKKILETFDR